MIIVCQVCIVDAAKEIGTLEALRICFLMQSPHLSDSFCKVTRYRSAKGETVPVCISIIGFLTGLRRNSSVFNPLTPNAPFEITFLKAEQNLSTA